MWRLLLSLAFVQLLLVPLAFAFGPRHITKSDATTTVLLDMPPREMWGWFDNVDGYCGECSFQTVGLYYGNYISQEEVRYADGNKELLVAVNDEKAAKALRLDYVSWDYNQKTPQSSNFLNWVRNYIDEGVPVISGWYIREKNGQGDADYDHIMPIVGYEQNADGSVAGLYHNDLYLQSHTYTSRAELFATRSGCSQSTTPTRPYDYCLPTNVDYGIAILGILDPKQQTVRTKLNISHWDEPDWGAEDNVHDKPTTVKVSAYLAGLEPGTTYSILRFDDVRAIPSTNSEFLSGSWTEKYTFKATATTQIYNDLDPIQSDGTYFFRTVVGS